MQHQLIFRSTADHVFNGSGKFAKQPGSILNAVLFGGFMEASVDRHG